MYGIPDSRFYPLLSLNRSYKRKGNEYQTSIWTGNNSAIFENSINGSASCFTIKENTKVDHFHIYPSILNFDTFVADFFPVFLYELEAFNTLKLFFAG